MDPVWSSPGFHRLSPGGQRSIGVGCDGKTTAQFGDRCNQPDRELTTWLLTDFPRELVDPLVTKNAIRRSRACRKTS